MDAEKEIIELKGRIRVNELKLKAIVKLLSKEGVLTNEEIDDELNDLLEKGEEG